MPRILSEVDTATEGFSQDALERALERVSGRAHGSSSDASSETNSVATSTDVESRAGFCALLGAPNAGKSTLLNRLCNVKLAAVSPKPQTTRDRILGVLNRPADEEIPQSQLVFVDTPGVERGSGLLRRYMHDEAAMAAEDCDVIVHVVDAVRLAKRLGGRGGKSGTSHRDDIAELLCNSKAPVILALNKVDKIGDKSKLLPILATLSDAAASDLPGQRAYQCVVPISAMTGVGVESLVREIAGRLPKHPPLYPSSTITDRPDYFRAAEFVREQLFLQLSQEIPYGTAVSVNSLEEHDASPEANPKSTGKKSKGKAESADSSTKKALTIDATVFVDRESQKGMVIGKGGQRIKEIGQRARKTIGESLQRPVHLRLQVKTLSGWQENPSRLRELGYGQ